MLVVADSSPLIVLVKTGLIDILPKLFGQIIIPPAVAEELLDPKGPGEARAFFSVQHSWLRIQKVTHLISITDLHRGEIEALCLAAEIGADLLLVDDRRAYKEAVSRKINAIGTVRVLELAADKRLLDLAEAFGKLKQTDFWISHDLLDARLKLNQAKSQRQ